MLAETISMQKSNVKYFSTNQASRCSLHIIIKSIDKIIRVHSIYTQSGVHNHLDGRAERVSVCVSMGMSECWNFTYVLNIQ